MLRQQRFLFDDEGADAATVGDTRWAIPVGVRQVVPGRTDAGSATVGAHRSRRRCSTRTSCGSPCSRPTRSVVVNGGGHGFFRVAYDDALRTRLAAAALRELSTVERYSLVDDTWAAVVAGVGRRRPPSASWPTASPTSPTSPCGRRSWPASAGATACSTASPASGSAPSCGRWWARACRRSAGSAADGEDDLTGELRGLLIRALAVLGDDAGAQATASELFEQQLRDPAAVDPPVTAAVVSVVAATGADGRVRPLRRALPDGDDTPGAAPLPVRAGRLPGRGR